MEPPVKKAKKPAEISRNQAMRSATLSLLQSSANDCNTSVGGKSETPPEHVSFLSASPRTGRCVTPQPSRSGQHPQEKLGSGRSTTPQPSSRRRPPTLESTEEKRKIEMFDMKKGTNNDLPRGSPALSGEGRFLRTSQSEKLLDVSLGKEKQNPRSATMTKGSSSSPASTSLRESNNGGVFHTLPDPEELAITQVKHSQWHTATNPVVTPRRVSEEGMRASFGRMRAQGNSLLKTHVNGSEGEGRRTDLTNASASGESMDMLRMTPRKSDGGFKKVEGVGGWSTSAASSAGSSCDSHAAERRVGLEKVSQQQTNTHNDRYPLRILMVVKAPSTKKV